MKVSTFSRGLHSSGGRLAKNKSQMIINAIKIKQGKGARR